MADKTLASNANDIDINIANAPTSVESNNEDFLSFLKRVSLEDYLNVFRKQGILKIEHFQDIKEDDFTVFGLSKF